MGGAIKIKLLIVDKIDNFDASPGVVSRVQYGIMDGHQKDLGHHVAERGCDLAVRTRKRARSSRIAGRRNSPARVPRIHRRDPARCARRRSGSRPWSPQIVFTDWIERRIAMDSGIRSVRDSKSVFTPIAMRSLFGPLKSTGSMRPGNSAARSSAIFAPIPVASMQPALRYLRHLARHLLLIGKRHAGHGDHAARQLRTVFKPFDYPDHTQITLARHVKAPSRAPDALRHPIRSMPRATRTSGSVPAGRIRARRLSECSKIPLARCPHRLSCGAVPQHRP